jgi:class 3 adenylate cyclase
MAARLQGQSLGGDIVLSPQVAEDPEVAALIGDLAPVGETAMLKGFEAPVPFLRVRPPEPTA